MPSFIRRFQYQQIAQVFLPGDCAFQNDTFQEDAFQVCPHGAFEFGSFPVPSWSKVAKTAAVTLIAASGLFATPTPPTEVITVDKWHRPFSEPVWQKPGLRVSLQQSAAGPVLNPDTQIIQGYESRWHYAWTEPVRQKPGLHPSRIPVRAFVALPTEAITADKWAYPWSEPVRLRQGLSATQQQALAWGLTTPEVVTLDKWVYPWTEPVRKRAGLLAALQRTTVRDPTVSPVSSLQPWFAPLSEPVRQKPGLRAHLQQASIQTVLDPDTQITQGYESRWHYPWSEPVRAKPGLRAANQEAFYGALFVAETITPDKWIYPWSEPKRLKPSLLAGNQQFLALDTAVIPTSTLQPWFAPLSEPVRLKPGLRAHLQQTAIQTVLDPDTQITQGYESRWHYAWSEPVRFRRFITAAQQSFAFGIPSLEIITPDKWAYPWSEPVRLKPGLRAGLQQSFIGTVLDPDTQITRFFESRWHYPWSEPVRVRINGRLAVALGSSGLIAPVLNPATQIIQGFESRWHYPWSEPVRQKQGLRAYLQQVQPVPVLNPNTQITQFFESRWHYPWSEPVRLKPGLLAALQEFFAQDNIPLHPSVIFGILDAIERGDLLFAGGRAFNQVGDALVGVVDIVPRGALVGVQVDFVGASSLETYVIESGAEEYITEDSLSPYVPETITVDISGGSANVGAIVGPVSISAGSPVAAVVSANVSIRTV